jgi:DNA polymerase
MIDWSSVWTVCHNAAFDVAILHKLGFRPAFVVDTLALASHVCAKGSHSLKDLVTERGWEAKGDTDQFRGLRWSDMTNEQRKALQIYNVHDVDLTARLFVELVSALECPQRELPIINNTIQLMFKQSIYLDAPKAQGILDAMVTRMHEVVAATGYSAKELSGDGFIEILTKVAGSAPIKQGKKKTCLALSKKDPERTAWEHHADPKVRQLIEARLLGKSLPLHIGRAKKLLAYAIARNGWLGFPVKYHAAVTGRFGGTGGINLQNMSTRGEGEFVELRKALVPPPGKEFRIYDYAQIEARGTAWLASCNFALDAFREGRDIYSELAEKVYNCKVWKPTKACHPDVASKVGKMRQVGKAGILGCGYGMSPAGMRNYLLRENIITDSDTSRLEYSLVDTYRKTYPQIPMLWDDLLTMAWCAVRSKTQIYTTHVAFICSEMEDRLKVYLPSGRPLYFYKPKAVKDRMGSAIEHEHGRIWKGLLAENIVQGFCRDILVDKILALEEAGIPVAYHIHDSIGFVVEKGLTEYPEIDRIMTEPLPWCKDLPLAVEAKQSSYFD